MRGKVPVLSKKIWYRPEAVRQHRSVLGAMCASIGAPVARFDLPIPQNWTEKADAWLRKWNPDRPLMIYRPQIGRASCRERVSVRVDLGGRRIIKKKKMIHHYIIQIIETNYKSNVETATNKSTELISILKR